MARYLIKKGDIKAKFPSWGGVTNEFRLRVVRARDNAFGWPIIVGWHDDRAWMKFRHKNLTVKLNDYFKHWQNPTKAEVDMFEMVTGEKYLTHYLGIELI